MCAGLGRLFCRNELKVKENVRDSIDKMEWLCRENRAMVRESVVLTPVERLKSWGGWVGEIRVSG